MCLNCCRMQALNVDTNLFLKLQGQQKVRGSIVQIHLGFLHLF